MSDRGSCPSCAAPVDTWEPVIRRDPAENMADAVIGWKLRPCGHRSDQVEWTNERGHRFYNGPL